MKRRGCIDCKLIEPTPGQWVDGRCPRCAEAAKKQAEAAPAEAKPVKMDETAERLRRYLQRANKIVEWRFFDRIREQKGKLADWPSWLFVPASLTLNLHNELNNPIFADNSSGPGLAGIVTMLAAWRATQGIYRFDPTVFEEAWGARVPQDLPVEVLYRMPEWCCYIETPGKRFARGSGGNDQKSLGFFVSLDKAVQGNQMAFLQFAIDHGGDTIEILARIPLVGSVKNGEQAWRETVRHIANEQGMDVASSLTMPIPEPLEPYAALALYLCADNAEIPGRENLQRPRPVKTKNGPRLFPPDKPKVWEVGHRLGAALRRAYELPPRAKPGDGTHAAPRPHIRRAHYHHFWTGPKAKPSTGATERKLVVHFLPPIPVNVSDDNPVIPTIHEVEPA